MPDTKATIQQLTNNLPQHGKVEWIGLRPQKRANMVIVDKVLAIEGKGLEGDHYAGRSGNRSVTLAQTEHLGVIASLLHKQAVIPEQLRRNIMVSGINLLALKGKRFRIGGALFEMTGACHPCSRMEEILGPGGYNAMRGHGGITVRIIQGGWIALGDRVVMLNDL
jgi:MOSC domain-containing protein YiiM